MILLHFCVAVSLIVVVGAIFVFAQRCSGQLARVRRLKSKYPVLFQEVEHPERTLVSPHASPPELRFMREMDVAQAAYLRKLVHSPHISGDKSFYHNIPKGHYMAVSVDGSVVDADASYRVLLRRLDDVFNDDTLGYFFIRRGYDLECQHFTKGSSSQAKVTTAMVPPAVNNVAQTFNSILGGADLDCRIHVYVHLSGNKGEADLPNPPNFGPNNSGQWKIYLIDSGSTDTWIPADFQYGTKAAPIRMVLAGGAAVKRARRNVYIKVFGLVSKVTAAVGDEVVGVDVLNRYSWNGRFPDNAGQVATMNVAVLPDQHNDI